MRANEAPRLSVLVIDDCPDTVWSTAELLRYAGHQAEMATTGRDGLAIAAGSPPDVVLLDLQLPDIDGYEVARRLRARSADRTRPVLVAVTGHVTEADRRRTAAAGFDLHLAKPVAPDELFAALDRFARVLGR